MNKSPAYQWYPKDILASQRVAEMSATVECWYRRALDFCWVNGSLPADAKRCAAIVGKGCTVKGAEQVLAMFVFDRKNSLRKIHDRQELERKKQAANRREKSKAGKASAEKRRKQKELAEQEAANSRSTGVEIPLQQNPTLQIAIASSISSPEKKKRTTTTTGKISDDEWLKSLVENPAYQNINVLMEFEKAKVWYSTHNRQVTRRAFVGWINRAKPMEVNQNGNSTKKTNTGRNDSQESTADIARRIGADIH